MGIKPFLEVFRNSALLSSKQYIVQPQGEKGHAPLGETRA
jgi:hypothetical protein